MKQVWLFVLLGVVIAGAVFMATTGCDEVKTLASIIDVQPAFLTVTGLYTISFAASVPSNTTLYLPLDWSVSDSRMGTISGQGGLRAQYTGRPMVGVNNITVRDQGEAEGFAAVNQRYYENMQVGPTNPSLDRAGEQVLLAVTPSEHLVLPLIWSVAFDELGGIVSSSGFTAVYMRTAIDGNNVVSVRDQMGASTSTTIDQD